jgi:hypothetical protein
MLTFEQASEILKAVGLVVSGLWVAWTFQKLQKARAAELENARKLTEIQKAHIEQEEYRTRLLRQQPQLAIHLSVAETASPAGACMSLLCITVTLKNEGDQNLLVRFDESTLTVGRVALGPDGRMTTGDVARFGPSYFARGIEEPQVFPERIFRIGQQRQMVLAILPVTEPSGYIVQFHALYGKVPFDGDRAPPDKPVLIDAIEQRFFFATGEPTSSACGA